MPIKIDIVTQLDRRSIDRAAEQATDIFADAGKDAGRRFETGLTAGLSGSTTAATTAKEAVRKVRTEVDGVATSARDVKTEFSALESFASGVFQGMSFQAGNLRDSLGSSAKGAGVVGAIALVTAGLATAATEMYNLGASWDRVTDNIAARTGATGDALESMKDQVKRAAVQTAAPLEDVGATLAQVAQSMHLTGDPLAVMTKKITDLNSLTGENTNIKQLGKVFRQFGIKDVDDQAEALNGLYGAFQDTGTSVNDMLENMSRSGSVLKEFNLDFGQTASLLTTLDEGGVDLGSATSGLKQALGVFARDGKPAAEGLRETVTEMEKLIGLGDNTGAQTLASKLFGEDAPAFLDAIRSGSLDVQTLNTGLQNTRTSIDEAKAETESWREEWQRLENIFKSGLEPAAAGFFGTISDGLEHMATWGAMKIAEFKLAWQDLFGADIIPNNGPAPTADMLAPGAGLNGWWAGSGLSTGNSSTTGNPMGDLLNGLGGGSGQPGAGGNSLPGFIAPYLDATMGPAGGSQRVPYGLPVNSNSGGYGGGGVQFPKWVNDLAAAFNLKPSTYPGHQSDSGQNRGIDWSGSVDDMERFAQYLATVPGMEQVIWANPGTGRKVGVAAGNRVGPGTSQPGYYRDDWADHMNHVHTRQSLSIPLPPLGTHDSGGYLYPGFNVTHNDTGQPERVLSPKQDDVLSSFLSGMQGAGGWGGMAAGFAQAGLDAQQGQQQPQGRAPTATGGGGAKLQGGALGMAESAATTALDVMAPGAGQGAQIAMQLAKRAAEFGGQAAAIGIQGVGETLLPNGSALGDPSRNWLGKILGGVSGVRPAQPTSAGQQEVPMQTQQQPQQTPGPGNGNVHGMGGSPGPGNYGIENLTMNVTSPSDSQSIARDIDRQINAHGAGMER